MKYSGSSQSTHNLQGPCDCKATTRLEGSKPSYFPCSHAIATWLCSQESPFIFSFCVLSLHTRYSLGGRCRQPTSVSWSDSRNTHPDPSRSQWFIRNYVIHTGLHVPSLTDYICSLAMIHLFIPIYTTFAQQNHHPLSRSNALE